MLNCEAETAQMQTTTDSSDVTTEDDLLGLSDGDSTETSSDEPLEELSDAEQLKSDSTFLKIESCCWSSNEDKLAQGPVVGYAQLSDTADVNKMLS